MFPIPRDSKRPKLERFWETASPDPDFSLEDNNAAVSTGEGIIVFDFDHKPDQGIDARETLAAWEALGIVPPTLTVRTPSGGTHVFLRTDPALKIKNQISGPAKGVDIRGHHGYVVAAGSTINGRPYEIVANPGHIAEITPELLAFCTLAKPRDNDAHVPLAEQDQPHMVKRALDWLAYHADVAVSGQSGDETTLRVAYRLRDMGLSEPAALDAMLTYWNGSKAIPPWEPDELAKKVANAFAYASFPAAAADATAEFSPIPNAEAIMSRRAALEQSLPAPSGADAIPKAPFTTWQPLDLSEIPKRDILYGNHYIRKFASVTVAPGGLGKSALALAEAVAMATGRQILSRPAKRLRVVYFNAEDPIDEIQRRVGALCLHYGIDQSELTGQFFIASGRQTEILLATGERGDINEQAFLMLEAFARENRIDVFVLDPLANMTTSDETNEVFRQLGRRISLMADRCNCAVEIVHHTRKLNGGEATVEDGRGGGALVNAVRSARVLAAMSRDEAAKAGLGDRGIDFFCIRAGGKSNLARAADRAEWYERASVRLPNGDSVAVVAPWQWPEAMDGVSSGEVAAVYQRIGQAEEERAPYRADIRAGRWAGVAVADVLGLDVDDPADKERAKIVLRSLIETGVLVHADWDDKRQGRPVRVVICGDMARETLTEGRERPSTSSVLSCSSVPPQTEEAPSAFTSSVPPPLGGTE